MDVVRALREERRKWFIKVQQMIKSFKLEELFLEGPVFTIATACLLGFTEETWCEQHQWHRGGEHDQG